MAKLPQLKVTARTSAFSFKGKNLPIPEIAKILGVANVIEGSARKSGNKIRITAQMIRASDGFHVWSETYDRELNDIFAIQDEISQAIVNALKVEFNFEIENNSKTQNLAAHNLYLRARSLMAKRSSENLNEALALLEQAILLDPGYADAYAAKSRILSVIISYDYSWPRQRVEKGVEEAVTKALALDPNNGEAYTARGNSEFFTQGKWLEAEKNLSRALELIPNNVSIHNSFGDYSIFTMDLEKALYHELRATVLDPLSSVHVFDLSRAYAARGDKDRATELLYTIPEFGVVAEYLTLDLLEAGKFEAAKTLWNDIYKDSPLKESLKGRAIQKMVEIVTNQDRQYDTIPEVITQALDQNVLQPSFVGRFYLILGDIDEALVHYNASYETGDSYLYYFPFSKTSDHYPDHDGWQSFWDLPGMGELDIIRRENMNVVR